MEKLRIMSVFGTRPEAIKMAPLVKAFQAASDSFRTLVCVTGQHREMLDQVLHIFDIRPDYDLNIMKQGQDLYDVTSRVLLGLREAFPDRREFRHAEGNSTAHLKCSYVGPSQTVLIEDGKPLLGIWQGVYFCEFDGPRHRRYYIKVMADN